VWGAQNEVAPLSIAARHGHIVITKKLLAAGADVNAQSEVRTSPLTASTTQGSPPPPPSEACPSSAASASAW
jgi:ankyrin repeat protein